MAKRFTNPLFYPAKGDFYHCELLEADPFVTIKTETGATVRTQMVGTYNFENIAVALCLGKYFGVEVQAANEAVVQYVPGNMRSQIIKKNSNTIILDAYNANPSSMEAAIENLGAMPAARKVAILGDMYELEGEAEAEHRHLGELLVQHNIHEVYLCGELIRAAQQTFPKARYFNTKTALTEALQKDSLRERLILVKASRGMRLEDVLEVI
jgi:UDP-N-acetylmuramoyl-tripeptide--D-alanyl-D-alanine ligase